MPNLPTTADAKAFLAQALKERQDFNHYPPSSELLTAEGLASQLGITPTTESPPAPGPSSFLSKQFPLFSTPALIIYLQGVLPLSSKEWALADYLMAAKSRTLNTSLRQIPGVETALVDLVAAKGFLYSATGKSLQVEFIALLASHGASIDPSRCLRKAFAESGIARYQLALADFLDERGFDSPEAYLEHQANRPGAGGITGLTQGEIDLLASDF